MHFVMTPDESGTREVVRTLVTQFGGVFVKSTDPKPDGAIVLVTTEQAEKVLSSKNKKGPLKKVGAHG